MIVSASPTMKPLSTGSEMNDATNPSRSNPASDAEDTGHDGEGRRERHELGGAAAGEVGDDRGRQRRRGRHGPDHQMTGGAEEGVEDQGGDGRVEPDHRGDSGDGGVGQRLGHEDGPHGQAGHQVGAQPRPAIALQ